MPAVFKVEEVKDMENNKVAVIGAGLMGSGIAQACAQAGYQVVNIDTFEAAVEKAKANINSLFNKKVQKGKITEEQKKEILGRAGSGAGKNRNQERYLPEGGCGCRSGYDHRVQYLRPFHF